MKNYTKQFVLVIAFILCFSYLSFFSGCSKPRKDNHFIELLSLLPISATESGGFVLIDYKNFYKENGISVTTSDGQRTSLENVQAIIEAKIAENQEGALVPMIIGSYYTGYGRYMFMSPVQFESTGYDFTFVDAEIHDVYQTFNSNFTDDFMFNKDRVVAAFGQFDPKATEEAFSNKSEWPRWVKNNYVSEHYQGITIHSWGDGRENHLDSPFSRPNLDSLGRASPMAVGFGQLFLSSSVDNVKLMIESSLNKTHSLADVEEYKLLAYGLGDLNVNVAIMADESLVNSYPVEYLEDKGPMLKNFITCATGYGKDEKGSYIALVIVHNHDEQAKEDVQLLKERIINSLFPIDDSNSLTGVSWIKGSEIIYNTEIHNNDKVLLAKLYTQDTGLWYKWFSYRSNILLHEK